MNISAAKNSASESRPAMRDRVIRRLETLTAAALEKSGDERSLITKTIVKILDECRDDEYDAILDHDAIKGRLTQLGIEHGWITDDGH